MTGGQAQIDAETKIAAHAHGRLESLLRGARTEECREEIVTAFQRYMGAQALVRHADRTTRREGGGGSFLAVAVVLGPPLSGL